MGTHTLSSGSADMGVKNLKLVYWESFGLAQGARYILRYKRDELPSTVSDYKFAEFEKWGEDKPKMAEVTDFPNLPCLSFEEEDGTVTTVTQSEAVLRTLGALTELMGSDLMEKARIEMVSGVLTDLFTAVVPIFLGGTKDVMTAIHEKEVLAGKCEQLDKHFRKFKFVAGETLSWCDFKALHYFMIITSASEMLRHKHKNIDRFMTDMVGLSKDFGEYVAEQNANRMIFPTAEALMKFGFGDASGNPFAGKSVYQIDPVFKVNTLNPMGH